ncbi:hypothetical protein ACW9UR_21395 [Halovulum sp. GXIMD14794]
MATFYRRFPKFWLNRWTPRQSAEADLITLQEPETETECREVVAELLKWCLSNQLHTQRSRGVMERELFLIRQAAGEYRRGEWSETSWQMVQLVSEEISNVPSR